MFDNVVTDLDSRELAAQAITTVRAEKLRVGAEQLALAAHWCDLHPVTEDDLPAEFLTPGQPEGVAAGADGTPLVSEFAGHELGCLLGIHPNSAETLMADAVNLRHRHPELWRRVMDGQVVDWVARKTSVLVAAAQLTLEQASCVDRATAPYAATLTATRYFRLVEAKIIEADPAAAEARAEAAALHRFVRTGQSDEHGLKTLVARANAGDVTYFVALVDRIAKILAAQGDTDYADVRRSKAIGILAVPTRALELLAWSEDPANEADAADGPSFVRDPVFGEGPTPRDDEPESEAQVAWRNDPARNAALARAIAEIMSERPERFLPPATLYLHLSAEAMKAGMGVARAEGVGPITVEQLREFLGHCNVTVKPVIDPEAVQPVDAYEIPERMGEAVRLRHPFETFPYSTRSSRGADLDHTKPYVPPDRGGPPGQTSTANLGPLHRRQHRLKTHAPGWRVWALLAGAHLWRTPTGYYYRVHGDGTTHVLGTDVSLMEQRLAALIPV